MTPTPAIQFEVHFPWPAPIMGRVVDTLAEARELIERYPLDEGRVFVRVPLELLGL